MNGLLHWHAVVALWFESMVRVCWQAALLVAIVLGICRLLPRLPAATRCTLWWLTCAGLSIGLLWATPITLAVLPASAPRLKTAVVHMLPGHRLPGARTGRAIVGAMTTDIASISAARPAAAVDVATDSQRFHGSRRLIALLLWAAGVALSLTATVRQALCVHRMTHDASPAERADVLHEARQIARAMGLCDAPRLLMSDTAPGSLTVGWRRPTIVLTATDMARLSSAELRGVLAHEIAHIRRCDLWLGLAPTLARTLLFFHPAVWIACREYDLAREAACDAEAVRVSGTRVDLYGQLLVKLSTTADASSHRVAALGLTADYRLLLRRLKGLEMIPNTPRRGATLPLLVVTGLTVLTIIPVRVTAHAAERRQTDLPMSAGIVPRRSVRRSALPPGTAIELQTRALAPDRVRISGDEDAAVRARRSADAVAAKHRAARRVRQSELTAQSQFLEAQRQALLARRDAMATQRRFLIAAVANTYKAKLRAMATQYQVLKAQRDVLAAEAAKLSALRQELDRKTRSADLRPGGHSGSDGSATPARAATPATGSADVARPGSLAAPPEPPSSDLRPDLAPAP